MDVGQVPLDVLPWEAVAREQFIGGEFHSV
jgi:hypothetical protein